MLKQQRRGRDRGRGIGRSREQRTGSREQSAESRDRRSEVLQGCYRDVIEVLKRCYRYFGFLRVRVISLPLVAESREQSAESREQRVESREQRA
jgi:hypothetical protein